MLSTITNCNIDTINTAINTFINLGLMEKWEDGTFYMMEVQNMVGSETTWAEKKRDYRNKKTLSSSCHDNQKTKKGQVRQEIEIDTDSEKWQKINEMMQNKQFVKDKKNEKLQNLESQKKENEILI